MKKQNNKKPKFGDKVLVSGVTYKCLGSGSHGFTIEDEKGNIITKYYFEKDYTIIK